MPVDITVDGVEYEGIEELYQYGVLWRPAADVVTKPTNGTLYISSNVVKMPCAGYEYVTVNVSDEATYSDLQILMINTSFAIKTPIETIRNSIGSAFVRVVQDGSSEVVSVPISDLELTLYNVSGTEIEEGVQKLSISYNGASFVVTLTGNANYIEIIQDTANTHYSISPVGAIALVDSVLLTLAPDESYQFPTESSANIKVSSYDTLAEGATDWVDITKNVVITKKGDGTILLAFATQKAYQYKIYATPTLMITIVGLTAAYAGGTLAADATLDDISVTVVGNMSDGSITAALTRGSDYELSGTLTPGQTNTITVTGKGDYAGFTTEFTVNVDSGVISVTGVSISQTSASLTIGDTLNLVATVTPSDATDKTVYWTSDSAAVLVSNSGVVTANAQGSGTITVKTADGGYEATCSISVAYPITVTVNASSCTYGGTEGMQTLNFTQASAPLVYTFTPVDGYEFTDSLNYVVTKDGSAASGYTVAVDSSGNAVVTFESMSKGAYAITVTATEKETGAITSSTGDAWGGPYIGGTNYVAYSLHISQTVGLTKTPNKITITSTGSEKSVWSWTYAVFEADSSGAWRVTKMKYKNGGSKLYEEGSETYPILGTNLLHVNVTQTDGLYFVDWIGRDPQGKDMIFDGQERFNIDAGEGAGTWRMAHFIWPITSQEYRYQYNGSTLVNDIPAYLEAIKTIDPQYTVTVEAV